MLSCINRNSREYQKLKQVSGIHESILDPVVREFITNHNRYPYLDEIPQANSEPYVRNQLLKIKGNSINTNKLLDLTSTHSLQDALISLNNEYRDLEITGLELGENTLLEIKHRPIKYLNQKSDLNNEYDYQNNTNSDIVYSDIITRLSDIYGIGIHLTNNSDPNMPKVIDATSAKGFIYNGEIYINTDNATLDTPLHELLHIIFGTMRYTNPELYFNTIQKAEQLPSYYQLSKLYPDRTRSDLAEEVYITEMAKKIAYGSIELDSDPNTQYEIGYHMDRVLDSALNGKYSVSCIDNPYIKPLKEVADLVESPLTNVKTNSILTADRVHRLLANTKSKLLKSKELQEDCA